MNETVPAGFYVNRTVLINKKNCFLFCKRESEITLHFTEYDKNIRSQKSALRVPPQLLSSSRQVLTHKLIPNNYVMIM